MQSWQNFHCCKTSWLKELELATLESTLQSFNRQYLKAVGAKYAELDSIEAEIAERLAARNPADNRASPKGDGGPQEGQRNGCSR